MGMRTKAGSLVAAVTIAATLGLAGAPAASAYVSYGYSNAAQTWSGCQYPQDKAIALKRAYGYRITHLSKCVRHSSGWWNGYFRYSKGGVTPV